jgi:peptidoglycan/LPS O-acetylase OafA/YrhL
MKIEKLDPAIGQINAEKVPANEKGFWVLNWLRFIVSLYIVLFHTLRPRYDIPHTWLGSALGLGNWGTSIFFVLSGFLLTHAYVVMKDGRQIDKRNFLTARFSSLYPLHIVATLLALIPLALTMYNLGGMTVPTEVSGPGVRMLGNAEFGLALFTNFAMLNAWNPFFLIINYPSWSLSALAFFYLLFPLLAPRIYRMKYPFYALIILGILFAIPGATAHFLDKTDIVTDGLMHRNPVIRLPLFVGGMVLCVLFARSRAPASGKKVVLLVGLVLATLAIGLNFQTFEARPHLIRNGLYYPASLAIIWLCICVRPTTNARLKYWGARLGAASLPMFLLHAPIYGMFEKFEKLVKAVALRLEGAHGSVFSIARDVEMTISFYPLYIVSLIVLCILVQERFVIPLQLKIRNYQSSRKAVKVAEEERQTGTA